MLLDADEVESAALQLPREAADVIATMRQRLP